MLPFLILFVKSKSNYKVKPEAVLFLCMQRKKEEGRKERERKRKEGKREIEGREEKEREEKERK